MTSYDEVWETFLNNYKVPKEDMPQSDEEIYRHIRNAVMRFNNRMYTNITCNDETETLSEELDDNQLLVLAHFIRLIFLINQRTFYEALWQPFSADVGLRNFKDQLNSLKDSIKEQESLIDRLIANMEEDYL